jgi:hypothetical protein
MIIPTHLVFDNNNVTIKNSLVDIKEFNKKNFLYECNYIPAENNNSYSDTNLKQEPYFFIFHKSRCGSTFLCNIFKQFDDILVLSEPEIFNQLMFTNLNDNIKKILLKRILNLMCNEAHKYNKKLVIKFTSYNVQFIDLYKSLYKTTKTIFSTRDTLEVIKSSLEKPCIMVRNNQIEKAKNFDISINSHYLYHIFQIDDFGKKCHHLIEYEELIKPNFIEYLKLTLNMEIDDKTYNKISSIKNKYSKGYDKKFVNNSSISKNNTMGIELYNNSLSKKNCEFIRNEIDKRANYVRISIKKCLSFSIFDEDYWKYYKKTLPDDVIDIQKDYNKAFAKTFSILKNIVYDKLVDYCKKYDYFYKSLCIMKTGNIEEDLKNNTCITTFNLTKYDPEIHDCSLFHSEDAFIDLQQASRKVAILFYLNDVENSGETEFLYQNFKIKPREGSLALFSPTWFNTHRGNVSHNKTKYIITSWVHGNLNLNDKLYKHYEVDLKEN